MMLRYTLAASLAGCAIALSAQPTLTSSNNIPAAGAMVTYQTANEFQGPGGSGNTTFGYWGMLVPTSSSQNIYYLAPSVTSTSAQIPTATLLSTDGGSDTMFYAVTGAGLELVGSRTNLEGILSFNDAALEMPYPCTFGTTWSDPTGDSYTVSGFPVTRTGTITGDASAWGTLHLPEGATYPNVLRVHMRRSLTDASAIVTTNRITHRWSYFNGVVPHPLVVLALDSTQINGGAWAITKRQHSVGEPVQVGIEENGGGDFTFTAYPNPAAGEFNIAFGEETIAALRVQVIDGTGRIVIDRVLAGTRDGISTQNLQPGIYGVRVLSAQRILGTSRVVVQ